METDIDVSLSLNSGYFQFMLDYENEEISIILYYWFNYHI
jgi:hypothetical protein